MIELEHVSKSFKNGTETLIVLQDISLEIKERGIFSITGESGSGKSTLLNIIGGLDLPTTGSVNVGGLRIDTLPEEKLTFYRMRTIGFIFQFHFLLKDFTALENVLIPGLMTGKNKKECSERASLMLERVNMNHRKDHFPNQLSGGERQRVAVARALMNDPGIILADEPTGNLDEKNSRNVEELLFGIVREVKKTLILVTHDQELAGKADLSFNLHKGLLERV